MQSRFLIGAAIGSGSTALAAERGGADILLAINAGRLRNMGAPSIACMLPIFDSPAVTESFAKDELLAQCRIPVLLGLDVWGADYDPVARARAVRDAGFAGAVNFPTCMHYSKPMQRLLARAGRGIEREVEQLRAVKEIGLTPMFYCATRTQARLAADAGIDLICLNLGWNVGGALGHTHRATIEEVAIAAREIGRLVKRINPATRFLLEGGPIGTADDLAKIVDRAPIDGYVGGSTIERMPLEVSVADQIDRFRHASTRRAAFDKESERLLAWSHDIGFVGRSKALRDYLKRLWAFSRSGDPLMLVVEPGLDPNPTLTAVNASAMGGETRGLFQIDVAGDDFPTRARNLLFGQRETIDRRRPLLADDDIGLLVIHAPHHLPRPSQRRLARALRDGSFQMPDTRRRFAVAPRVALVCETPASVGGTAREAMPPELTPELAGLVSGHLLRLPPLRERTDDIPAILDRFSRQTTGNPLQRSHFSVAAMQRLLAHHWPENEEELRALFAKLAGREWRDPVQPSELDPLLESNPQRPAIAGTEKDRIVDALWRNGFNRTRTARALGISRKTLYNKISKYGLTG